MKLKQAEVSVRLIVQAALLRAATPHAGVIAFVWASIRALVPKVGARTVIVCK